MGGVLKDRLDSGCEICMPSGFCTLNHRASRKRQEVTSRIAKYFAPSFFLYLFFLIREPIMFQKKKKAITSNG